MVRFTCTSFFFRRRLCSPPRSTSFVKVGVSRPPFFVWLPSSLALVFFSLQLYRLVPREMNTIPYSLCLHFERKKKKKEQLDVNDRERQARGPVPIVFWSRHQVSPTRAKKVTKKQRETSLFQSFYEFLLWTWTRKRKSEEKGKTKAKEKAEMNRRKKNPKCGKQKRQKKEKKQSSSKGREAKIVKNRPEERRQKLSRRVYLFLSPLPSSLSLFFLFFSALLTTWCSRPSWRRRHCHPCRPWRSCSASAC